MLFTDMYLESTVFWDLGLLPSLGDSCYYTQQFYYPVFLSFWQTRTQDYELCTVSQIQIRLCYL